MGIFDFIKGAGEKILDLNPAKKVADILIERVRKHRLGKDDIKIEAEGDKVKVSGTANSQAEKEKIILAVGNVNGVAQVEENIKVLPSAPAARTARALSSPSTVPTSASDAPSQFYTVVKGDTLSKISKQFYGSAQKYQRIFEANRPLLQHPDKIYPGQMLRIPPAA